METENKAFLPWRGIEVEKNSECQEVKGHVYAQCKCKRDLLRLLPLHSCTKPSTTPEGVFIYTKFSVACI